MIAVNHIRRIKNNYHNKPLIIEGANGSIGLSILSILKKYYIKPNPIILTTLNSKIDDDWLKFNKKLIHLKSKNKNFFYKKLKAIKNLKNINIIYCAGYGRPNFFLNNPLGIIDANITKLIDYANFKNINTFAFISTSEIYSGHNGSVHENINLITSPQHPRGVYIESKRLAESIVENILGKVVKRYASFRVALAFPPKLLKNDNRVLADLIKYGLKNKLVLLNGGGELVRQYQYGPNCALKILAAMSYGKSNLYNNSGNHIVKLKQLANIIGEILKLKVKINKSNPLDRTSPKKVLINSTLLNKEIKYQLNKEKDLKYYLTKMINSKFV